ncbi:transglycosylase domain-containing protein [Flavobacterium sp.]|uniref:transglycosylase domain-containing protein n=1 Tax=Flavobacterium sp. TaxID=239 RepID=UPI003B99D4A0
MKISKKFIYRSLLVFLAVCLIIVGCIFAFRQQILDKVIAKAKQKCQTEYQAELHLKAATFTGLTTVEVSEFSIVPMGKDTLISVDRVEAKAALFPLFLGNLQLDFLHLKKGKLQLITTATGSNFETFLKSKNEVSSVESSSDSDVNYARKLDKLSTVFLNLIPTQLNLSNFQVIVNDKGKQALINVRTLAIDDEELQSEIAVKTNTFEQIWTISGEADPRDRKADLVFTTSDPAGVKLPYFDERFQLQSSFKSARLQIEDIDTEEGNFYIQGYSELVGLRVNQPKIAVDTVYIPKLNSSYKFVVGPKFVAIDSSTTAKINNISFKPYVKLDFETDTIFDMKVSIPKMQAQAFLNSLPVALFPNTVGMKASGNFAYKLNFHFNKNNLKDVVFESNLDRENLKIISYGKADIPKINGVFAYSAIENGKRQREIIVGPENPNFTTLAEIAPELKSAVLTSEDPSFFSHKGFVTEAFKQSIVKNFKTKKFSRGGSTISMQLVKNVFLTRQKTLARKLEEILLVYILENNRIVSKSRMLEVYFNIIEWGPNVYGIGEASRFYFQKSPANLTVDECIFLAGIIPSPKKFNWQFNSQGELKPYVRKQHEFIKSLMIRRGLYRSADSLGGYGGIRISGPASGYIKIAKEVDSTAVDSLEIEEFEF